MEAAMRVFLTGANGFIGGSVAARLIEAGHTIRGLVRDRAKADLVAKHGIEPVVGSLDDAAMLADEARKAEAVVNAADSDHRGAAEALVAGLAGSGKPLLHTSGSSIVADRAMGELSDKIYTEDTPIVPDPEKLARVELDNFILAAAGVRSVVLCNTTIYGTGLGAEKESDQVPKIAHSARDTGAARYIGRGLNRWSNIHVADMADLYLLSLEKAPAGSFFYLENGEESFGDVARAVAKRLGVEAKPWASDEAAFAAWGRGAAIFGMGSNSRVRDTRARALGWKPHRRAILDWIASELPRA
jgi:nucleoside-diphosphate-sugar epimerase